MYTVSQSLPGRGYFRTLLPWEHARYGAHLRRLSFPDRRKRFLSAPSDTCLDAHARRTLSAARTQVIGWFLAGELRGVVELVFGPRGQRSPVEAAFSVEMPQRRNGVGTSLMRRAIRSARNRGVGGLYAITEPGNIAMLRLANKYGAEFRTSGGVAETVIPLSLPTHLSWLSELQEEEGAAFVSGMSLFADRARSLAQFPARLYRAMTPA